VAPLAAQEGDLPQPAEAIDEVHIYPRPRSLLPVGPFGPFSIFGYFPRVTIAPQPIGHHGYVYRPIFEEDGEPGPAPSPDEALDDDSYLDADALAEVASTPDSQLWGKAREAFFESDYEACARFCESMVVRGIDDGSASALRAQALMALGEYLAAAEALRDELMLAPAEEWGRVVAEYADYYTRSSDFRSHLRALERFVRDTPGSMAARLVLGYQYGFLGFYDEAIDQLEIVLARHPDDACAQELADRFDESRRRARRLQDDEAPGAKPRRREI
jgi:tetratricopeptide (TPR) repeat protein